ncbi:hypothetical protein [Vulcanisaeta thermophila]|uniref:hypothetical protein n=1 Tax=Vulcanisaeta thermophila TaxID=867917 RepID=UPI0008534909|nr:hypothetical protein [Vulcanisaeta thermophila]
MKCIESEYLPIIRFRMKCGEADPINVGFGSVKPDLKCGDVVYEVECEDRAHYGLGQALAYLYGGSKSGLIIIVTSRERYDAIRQFLKWVRSFGIVTKMFVCLGGDCVLEDVS